MLNRTSKPGKEFVISCVCLLFVACCLRLVCVVCCLLFVAVCCNGSCCVCSLIVVCRVLY